MNGPNIPRCLPFSSWDEWIAVKSGLFSSERDEVAKALQMVTLWRCRGRLPISVDSTASLVELRGQDAAVTGGYLLRSEYESKLMFSAVIVRTVNGLVDPGQQGIYASSVLTLAEKIGIPGWIVELRHDATHNQLPSLSVLRSGASVLLAWLYDNYWLPQLNLLHSLSASSLPTSLPAAKLDNKKKPSVAEQSSTEIDTSLQDSSPTYVAEIFVPVFLGAALHSPAGISASTAKKPSVEKEVAQQLQTWTPRLKALLTANASAVHLLIVGCLDAVTTMMVQTQNQQLDTESLEMKLSTLVGLLKGAIQLENEVNEASRAADKGRRRSAAATAICWKFVRTIIEHVHAAAADNECDTVVSELIDTVRGYYQHQAQSASIGAGSASAGASDSGSVLGKRKQEDDARATLRSSNLIARDSNCGVWPLGFMPGTTTCGDLLRLEEAPLWPE